MKTAEAFEEILLFARACNSDVRVAFSGEFTEIITRFKNKTKLSGSRVAGKKIVAQFTREMKNSNLRNVMDTARRSMAAALLEASFYRYSNSEPKLHHWAPICYLSQFTRNTPQKSSRGAVIPSLDYSGLMIQESTLTDRSFAHKPKHNTGFYELSAERFFSIIESRYSNAILRIDVENPKTTDFYLATFVCMMVIQTMRSPHPGEKKFELRTLGDFANAIEELLDTLDEGFAYLHYSEKPLPFTPYAPTRARISVKGKRSWYFPLTSNLGFVLSEDKLDQADLERAVEGSRIATVKWAQRHGERLFGYTASDISNL